LCDCIRHGRGYRVHDRGASYVGVYSMTTALAWVSGIIDAAAWRIRPYRFYSVAQPIDRARQAKLGAELDARRADWEVRGRAAADERYWRSVALTVAKAESEKARAAGKARAESEKKPEPVESVAAIPAAVPDVLPPKMSFVYLIASSTGRVKIGKADNVPR